LGREANASPSGTTRRLTNTMNFRVLSILGLGIIVGVIGTLVYESTSHLFRSSSRSDKMSSMNVLYMSIVWPPNSQGSNEFARVFDLQGRTLNLRGNWEGSGIQNGIYYFLIPGDLSKIDESSAPVLWSERALNDKLIGYDYISCAKKVKLLAVDEFCPLLQKTLIESGSSIGLARFDGKKWIVDSRN